jgi:hypothetical protein
MTDSFSGIGHNEPVITFRRGRAFVSVISSFQFRFILYLLPFLFFLVYSLGLQGYLTLDIVHICSTQVIPRVLRISPVGRRHHIYDPTSKNP